MCELLIRVVSKVNADPYLDAKCTKRGDVIAVVEDGWAWGTDELANPHWRIVRVTGVPAATAAAFISPEIEIDPANPSLVLQRRGFSFDLSNALIPTVVKTWLADDTRAAPIRVFAVSAAVLGQLKKAKARLTNPAAL